MQLEYQFTVPVPASRALAVLLDVERVAPCVPGATLTAFDGTDFQGTVKVRLGPVSLTYRGKGRIVEHDEPAGRVSMVASGQDSRGAGMASATVTAAVAPAGDPQSTVVTTTVDLTITGRAAQYGRGMIAEVGGKLVAQFADCLAQRLAEAPPKEPAAVAEPVAEPAAVPVESAAAVADAEPAGAGAVPAEAALDPVEEAAMAVPAPAPGLPGPVGVAGAPPVNLLAVGAGPVLRRVVPYVIGFVLGVAVTWAAFALF